MNLGKLNLCHIQHFQPLQLQCRGGLTSERRRGSVQMANLNPSSVTLIFYKLGPVRQEPLLNIVASALQWSSFCHTEIAIGENRTADGAMVNVARVFNDAVGVVKNALNRTLPSPQLAIAACASQELTARTGRNPNYVYVQLGCSELATQRMLQFARAQVGKPFSQMGMARSIVWPRKTDCTSWCADSPMLRGERASDSSFLPTGTALS